MGQESSQHQQGSNLLMNMELGGVSTWTKRSTGGPPAPGQTEGTEGCADDVLGGLGSSEEQQLAGPGFTHSDEQVESPTIGKSRYLAQEVEDPFAEGSGSRTVAAEGSETAKKGAGWDNVSLDS